MANSNWRDEMGQVTLPDGRKLVAGTFRGVPFRTVDAEMRVGRRNVVNEYPQRDLPYVDDLGRRARRFVVEAYVIGDGYRAERDALIAAFEGKGSGELIHPRYGLRKVSIDGDVSIKETPERGGMARISVTFVEDTSNTFPAAAQDTVAKVESTTNAADAAIEEAFTADFSVDGMSVLATDALKGMTAKVNGLLQLARQVTSVAGLATIVRQASLLSGGLTALIRTPAVLVQSLRSIYAELIQEVERPLSALSELQSVFFANARPSGTARAGSTRALGLANESAQSDLQRRLALTNQARLLAVALSSTDVSSNRAQAQARVQTVTFSSADVVATSAQATALRDALVAQIDIELEVNDPPAAVARALTNVRAAVVRDVAVRSEFLLNRASYTPQAVLPALVLAHRIYQDAWRADELAARNGVPHPAFMPARPLEILR